MAEHVLTLVAAPEADDARRLLRGIIDRWPAGEPAPQVQEEPLDRLLEAPEDEADGPIAGAMVIVLSAALPAAFAFQVVDRLQRSLIPALVLTPTPDARLQRLQTGGVIVRPTDADPAFLAHSLFALAERQSVVRSLARELRTATRYSGGVRGEIDRIHDELNLAASIQHEIMPRSMPEIEGLEFGVIFRPVGYVSGDIYDVSMLDDRHVGFLIADAVGHGVPAALMTMVINRSLRLVRAEDGSVLSPGEVLTRLNADLMRGRRHSPRFGTAVCGILDTQAMRITLAAAGHPQPILVRRGGPIEMVQTDGALLGVFPDEQYSEVTLTLGPDETLLIYSDGLETAFANPLAEQRHQRRRSAEHKYVEALQGLRWPGAESGVGLADSIGALEHLIDEQDGSLHQADDITAVAIRRVARAGAVLRAA